MAKAIIDARDVLVELGGTPVLAGVGLTAGRGEVVAVVGENGSGKSTLLRCLAGLHVPQHGQIDVLDGPPADSAGFWRQVVLVGDEPAWYPGLGVGEHLELMRAVHGQGRMTVDETLETFELAARADLSPLTLSTGQRQRLVLAMALIRPSTILLLDEPERGLDAGFKVRLAAILTAYAEAGGTIVMATHDRDLATATGARLLGLAAA